MEWVAVQKLSLKLLISHQLLGLRCMKILIVYVLKTLTLYMLKILIVYVLKFLIVNVLEVLIVYVHKREGISDDARYIFNA